MLTALIAFVGIGLAGSPTTVEFSPTDTIWVYPNASDPAHDDLYVWGSDGVAVPPTPAETPEFSFAYLKWDLGSAGLSGATIIGAQLVVTHTPDPAYSQDDAKASPLEARPLPVNFSGKTWSYDVATKNYPEKDVKSIFGSISPNPLPKDGKPFKITIDLFKGPGDFKKYVATALDRTDHQMAIALTSTIDPSALGHGCEYKLFSNDGAKENRPILRLVYKKK